MNLDKAVSLIKQFEGFSPTVYKDSAGVPTVGYGSTLWQGKPVAVSQKPITEEQAANQLEIDVRKFAIGIGGLLKVDVNENQLCALVVLAYNIGISNFASSSALRAINEGDDNDTIKSKWVLWNKSKNASRPGSPYIVLPGLVRRRAAEIALFDTPVISSEQPGSGI